MTLGAVWVEEGTGGLFHTRVPDVLQMHMSSRQSRAAIGDGGGDNGDGGNGDCSGVGSSSGDGGDGDTSNDDGGHAYMAISAMR